MRHRVISQNIANINTPGYRAKEVLFEDELARRLATPTSQQTLNQPVIQEAATREARFDGNTVDIDLEMTALEKNSMMYQAYTELLSSKISMMKSAITGR